LGQQGQPIVFHRGWLRSDWDAQMLFFLQQGYRVVGIDRRGHGRSSQMSGGHDMDHYAADAAAVVDHLNLRDAVHVGHPTGGGEVARYVARHGKGRVAKAVLMSAVTPLMLKTPKNSDGTPIEAFDGLRKALAANRSQDFTDDLKMIDVPTLAMHGDDDQIVPYKDASLLSVKLLKKGTLKIYPGFPHGMLTTHADVINKDMLAFFRSSS
jgi:non-heme chloroperoxidase